MVHFEGIDLHSNSSYIAVIDTDNNRTFKKKARNNLSEIIKLLAPFKEQIKGIVVESTYNWYCWRVDRLMDNGCQLHLSNPSAIKQYEGLKHCDDITDAFHLANLLRLSILPEGYIYPKHERPVRDLLRKRMHLVRQRTALILSFQNLIARNPGKKMNANTIKKLTE